MHVWLWITNLRTTTSKLAGNLIHWNCKESGLSTAIATNTNKDNKCLVSHFLFQKLLNNSQTVYEKFPGKTLASIGLPVMLEFPRNQFLVICLQLFPNFCWQSTFLSDSWLSNSGLFLFVREFGWGNRGG